MKVQLASDTIYQQALVDGSRVSYNELRMHIERIIFNSYKVQDPSYIQDLVSEIIVKLLASKNKYDVRLGKFTTYLTNMVKWHVKRADLKLRIHGSSRFGANFHSGRYEEIKSPISLDSPAVGHGTGSGSNEPATDILNLLEDAYADPTELSAFDEYNVQSTSFNNMSEKTRNWLTRERSKKTNSFKPPKAVLSEAMIVFGRGCD